MSEEAQMGPGPGDELLNVEFYWEGVKDEAKTAIQGTPAFKDVEWVRITVPGCRTEVIDRQVREIDKVRWPDKYADFKRGETRRLGTPLKEWVTEPKLKPSQVKELDYHGITTVEALASVSDANLSKVGLYRPWREKAREYVKDATANAPISKVREAAASQAAEIAELRAELERLKGARK